MSLIQDPATAEAANVVDAVTPNFTGKKAVAVAMSAAIPLTPGVATSALQTSGNASLTSLDAKTPSLGQSTMANSQPVVIASNQTGVPVTDNGGSLTVDGTVGIAGTVPVSIAAQPLPTGAATAALQTQPGVDIGDVTINNATGAAAVNIQDGGNSITIDGTVGISGTVAVSAVALPLPAGAASETTLAALNTKHPAQGQALMAASVPVVIASNQSALAVTLATQPLPTGAATAALQTQPGVDIGDVTINNGAAAAAVNIQDGGNSITVDGTVGISGTVPISATALPLPTGAATETTLAALNTKTPALGQALMAASQPVTIASNQSALTVAVNNATGAAAVNIQDGGNSITVDGAVTANIGTTNGLALDATLTGGTQRAIVRSAAKGATVAADITSTGQSVDRQALDVQIRTSAGVAVDAFGNTVQFADGAARGTATGTLCMGDDGTNIQSINVDTAGRLNINNISGAVTLPTGAATAALQTQPGVDIGDVTINNAVGAAAVNIQDGGNSITVDGTVGISGTVAVSAATLPLPTGAATETTLATRLADSTFTGRINTLGQKAMAASTPVTLASDQSALAVTLATQPLPTGAATAALQTQPGVDIGDVTINNAGAAAAVNIQDGGNSITVDGTVIANIGTTNGLALDATLTGGTQKAVARGGAKGATTAADVTSTNQSADRQAIDVQIRTSAGVAVDAFGGGIQFADGAARGTATGTLCMGDDGTNIQSINVDTAGRLNINSISGTVTLPTGAATEASLTTRLADATFTGRINTLGQKVMAASTPVTLASDQSALAITLATQPLPTGASTAALQTQPGVDIGDVTINNAVGAAAVNIQDGGNSITVDGAVSIVGTVPVSATALPLPTGAATETTLAALNTKTPALGQALMAASQPVTIASNQTNLGVVGAAANAAAVAGNPVLVAGTDGTNARTLLTDILGNLRSVGPVRTRVSITFQANAPAVADTLLTLNKITNGVTVAGTSVAVTAGKILHITNIVASTRAGAAAAAFGTLNVRINPAGAAVLASISEFRINLGNTEAVIGGSRTVDIAIPDGFELSGTTQLGCSFAAQATTNIVSITLLGYEY